MESSVALYSAGGTLAVALGYIILKRCRNSNCVSHTKFCDCESPAVELQKKQTERLEVIMEMLRSQGRDLSIRVDRPQSPSLSDLKNKTKQI